MSRTLKQQDFDRMEEKGMLGAGKAFTAMETRLVNKNNQTL